MSTLPNIDLEYQHGTDVVLRRVGAGEATAAVLLRPATVPQIEATALAERLERVIQDQALPDTDLVGPAPAFMERLRGRYRWQVLVRSPDPRPVLRALLDEDLPFGWAIDVDPMTSL